MDLRSLIIRGLIAISKELIREGFGGKTPRRGFSKLTQEVTRIAQNFRCNRCGKILGEEYNFHHKDGNRSNNYISNCEVLCLDCHYKETRRARIRHNFGRRVA